MLTVGEGPGETPSALRCLSHQINSLLNDIKQIVKTSKGGTLSALFWCLCQKLLYCKKTLLHKSSEWSSLITGPGLNSSPLEAKNPAVFHSSATTFQYKGWPVMFLASFPVTVSWEDCPFLHVLGLISMNYLATYMWVYSQASSSFPVSVCLCLCQFFPVVVTKLCDVVRSQRGRSFQVCSSFSESFWLFKVLSCCRLILGIFLFLWKMPLDITLWLKSVHLLMALVGMDILTTHCSSAWAWNMLLFICVFFITAF